MVAHGRHPSSGILLMSAFQALIDNNIFIHVCHHLGLHINADYVDLKLFLEESPWIFPFLYMGYRLQ